MSRLKKRFWAEEEKREICARASTPGILGCRSLLLNDTIRLIVRQDQVYLPSSRIT